MAAWGEAAVPLLAADNRLETGKPAAAAAVAPRKVALGEVTNTTSAAGNGESTGSTKPVCVTRPFTVQPPVRAVVEAPAVHLVHPVGGPATSLPRVAANERLRFEAAFSEALLFEVQDGSAEDCDQLQGCSEYVIEIHHYLHQLEVEAVTYLPLVTCTDRLGGRTSHPVQNLIRLVQQAVRADYLRGCEITGWMRALLVDWLVRVHAKLHLLQDVLFMTVAIVDRFLQVQPVSRKKLQLVGIAAMLLACKYEQQRRIPTVDNFICVSGRTYCHRHVVKMEKLIWRRLDFQLGRPLPAFFLHCVSKVADCDLECQTMAKYLMELTLQDYETVHYRPSEVAAASLCLSQLLLAGRAWSPEQQHYSTYDEAHLKPLMQLIAKTVVMVNNDTTGVQAVRKKYSSDQWMYISLSSQLFSSTITNMAAR